MSQQQILDEQRAGEEDYFADFRQAVIDSTMRLLEDDRITSAWRDEIIEQAWLADLDPEDAIDILRRAAKSKPWGER